MTLANVATVAWATLDYCETRFDDRVTYGVYYGGTQPLEPGANGVLLGDVAWRDTPITSGRGSPRRTRGMRSAALVWAVHAERIPERLEVVPLLGPLTVMVPDFADPCGTRKIARTADAAYHLERAAGADHGQGGAWRRHPQLAGMLARLIAQRPGVAVADRNAMTTAHAEQQQIQASVNYLMVGMIMEYTATSVVTPW